MEKQEIIEMMKWLLETEINNIKEYRQILSKLPLGITQNWPDFDLIYQMISEIHDYKRTMEE
jgi:hypothetical protein